MITTLKFGQGNAKLPISISTFSLPAGHSCPFAKQCKSQTDLLSGKIQDGEHCLFRCFSATTEARATSVRKQRWENYNLLRNTKQMEKIGEIIQQSLTPGMEKVRVHVSGDFFSEAYFLAWVNVAYNNPLHTFYGYTKAIPFLVKYKKYLPNNFRFTASYGGTHDHLITEHNLVSAQVVFSMDEAAEKGLEIDHDDSHALRPIKPFALLLHGTQAAGSVAGKAWVKIVAAGIGGYSKHKSNLRKDETLRPLSTYITLKNGKVFLPMKKKGLVYA